MSTIYRAGPGHSWHLPRCSRIEDFGESPEEGESARVSAYGLCKTCFPQSPRRGRCLVCHPHRHRPCLHNGGIWVLRADYIVVLWPENVGTEDQIMRLSPVTVANSGQTA